MEMINKKDIRIITLLGAIFGIVTFVLIYGVKILDVTYDKWLYIGGDLSQHYIGWKYYRNSDWQIPLGIIKNLSDLDTCIIYTDSIPVLAIIFKLFRNILPERFQYFGLWGILSYCLMGIISARMLYKLTNNKVASAVGSCFFILSPYMLQRMFAHTSLAGQWILVLAISYYLTHEEDSLKRKTISWTIILLVAALIHIYFIPMIVAFIFFDMIRSISKNGKKYIIVFFVPILATLLELTVVGAFSTMGDAEADGLGYFSANINALINPIFSTSKFIRELAHGSGQYEGYGYLGVGIIILVILDLFILLCNKGKEKSYINENIFLVIIAAIFFILALSPTIMIGDKIIFTIPYPTMILKILNIFRSSGRFVWITCYILITCVIVVFVKKMGGNKQGILIISVCLLLQIFDLWPGVVEKYNKFHTINMEQDSNLNVSEEWRSLLKDKSKVIFIPYDMVYVKSDIAYLIENMSSDEMAFNMFVVCRPDKTDMSQMQEEYMSELTKHQAREDYVYVFDGVDELLSDDYGLIYYKLNDCVVGVKKEIQGLEQYLLTATNKCDLGFPIDLSDMKIYQPDMEDEQLIIGKNEFMYGPYYSLKRGTYMVDVKGTGLDHINWVIESHETESTFYCDVLEQKSTHCRMKIVIDKDNIQDVEIKAYNDGNQEVQIEDMYIKNAKE